MVRFAIFLLILGVGSFILPLMGRQFILMSIFGEAAPAVAIGMIILGGVLLVLGIRKQ